MQVFEMDPAGARWAWVPLLFLLLTFAAVAGMIALTMRPPRFEVSAEGLRIRGNLYGRLIPAAQLRTSEAHVVDFEATPALRPKRRTNGASLGGRRAGWFRLQNGEKSLVFTTGGKRAAYIPTVDGYALLLGARDPDALLAALRAPQR